MTTESADEMWGAAKLDLGLMRTLDSPKTKIFLKISELKNFNFCKLKVMKIYFWDLQDVKLKFFLLFRT